LFFSLSPLAALCARDLDPAARKELFHDCPSSACSCAANFYCGGVKTVFYFCGLWSGCASCMVMLRKHFAGTSVLPFSLLPSPGVLSRVSSDFSHTLWAAVIPFISRVDGFPSPKPTRVIAPDDRSGYGSSVPYVGVDSGQKFSAPAFVLAPFPPLAIRLLSVGRYWTSVPALFRAATRCLVLFSSVRVVLAFAHPPFGMVAAPVPVIQRKSSLCCHSLDRSLRLKGKGLRRHHLAQQPKACRSPL